MVTAHVVDFTNVKDAAKFTKRRVPSGDYLARVTKVEDAPSKNDQTPQYLFTIVLDKYKHDTYPYYCKLAENQLWKLRNLLVAAGVTVPKKRFKVDPNRAVGRLIAVSVDDDEYEGREQSVINSVFPASELTLDASSDTQDDAPESDDAEEAEDEAEEETEEAGSDEFDGMDRGELKTFIRGHDSNFRFLKSHSDDDLRTVARQWSEDVAAEEEEEEPEPVKPVRTTKAKAKPKPPAEDEELDIDDL